MKFGAGPKFDILMGAMFVMHLEAWLLAPSTATVISKLNVLISNAVSCGNVASVHHNSLSPSYSLSSYPTKHNPIRLSLASIQSIFIKSVMLRLPMSSL